MPKLIYASYPLDLSTFIIVLQHIISNNSNLIITLRQHKLHLNTDSLVTLYTDDKLQFSHN